MGSRKTTPSAHEPLISWESAAEVPLAGLSFAFRFTKRHEATIANYSVLESTHEIFEKEPYFFP